MKRNSLIISSCLSLVIVLSACNNTPNTHIHNTENVEIQEAYTRMEFVRQYQQEVYEIDKNVDWNKPLYSLGENNDTIEKWTYYNTGNGMCVIHKIYSGSYYDEGIDKISYDKQNRIISEEKSDNNGLYFTMKYYYDGNVRIGNGNGYYDGSNVDVKEISYFLDKSFKYDTLTQTYIGMRDISMELTEYIKSKYEKVDDKYLIMESRRFDPKDTALKMGDKHLYKYNSQNLLVGKLTNNVGEYGTTTYSYHENTMEWSNTGTGTTIYYDTKK